MIGPSASGKLLAATPNGKSRLKMPPSPTIDRCKTAVLAPLAFAKLNVFTELAAGPATAEALAGGMDVDPEWLEPLLFAFVAAGLLESDDGRSRIRRWR